MILIIGAVMAGACIGTLGGSSHVPVSRRLPTIATLVLSLIAATCIVVLDRSGVGSSGVDVLGGAGFAAAMALVVAVLVSSVLYASVWWYRCEAVPLPFATIVAFELRNPGHLREIYAEWEGIRDGAGRPDSPERG